MSRRTEHPPSCIVTGYWLEKGRTLCGKKAAEVGITGAHAVQAHIDGHGARFCPECFALWDPGASQPSVPASPAVTEQGRLL